MELANSAAGKLLCKAFKLGERRSGFSEEMLLDFIDAACVFTETKPDSEEPVVTAGKIAQIEPNTANIKIILTTGATLFFTETGGWSYTVNSHTPRSLKGDLRLKKDF